MANDILNQVVSYGLQNKKKKEDILSALLKSGQVDVPTAVKSVKDLTDMGAFDYQQTQETNIDPQKSDEISSSLVTSVGNDGKVDPNIYTQKKQEFLSANPQGADTFDTNFSHLLSDQEQKNLGVKSNAADENGTFPQALANVDKGTASVVKQLTEYKIPLPSGMALKTPYWQKVLELSSQYDPSFDSTQYNARLKLKNDFVSGKAAVNIRSLNTAVGHLDTLKQKAEALNNGGIPLWNKIANVGLSETGDKRVTEFNNAATAVESELAAVFKGMGATDQEIKQWRANLDASQSPEQLKGAIDTAVELMGSRLDALQSQYETGMGKQKDFKFLNDKSQKILKDMGIEIGTLDYSTKENQTDQTQSQSQIPQTEDNMPAVLDFIKNNPDNQDAQKLAASIRNGEIDPITGVKKNGDSKINNTDGKGFLEKQFTSEGKTPLMNAAVGVGKGVLSTIQGLETIGQKTIGKAGNYIAEKITGKKIQSPNATLPEYMTKAEGTAQSIGKGVEQIGEFFLPSTLAIKGARIVDTGIEAAKLPNIVKGGTKLLSKMGISGAETGAVTAVQSGGDTEQTKQSAKLGAAIPVAGTLIGKVSNAFGGTSKALAKKIEQVSLRLTPAQKNNLGKKLDDVTEFLTTQGITGNPTQRYQKVEELYNAAEDKLSSFIKKYAPAVKADTDAIITQVKNIASKYKNDRDIVAVEKQLGDFVDLLKSRYKGKIPLDALNELKRSTFKGAYNKAGSKVLDSIEHEIGGVLNKNIQKITEGLGVAGQDIKSFNKGYGTLIESKKLLDIAKTRPELGLVGKLIATSVGGSIGTAIGGGIGTAAGLLAGQQGGKLLAGTAMRSQVVKVLTKLSKLGKVTDESASSIKSFIFGGGKKVNLTPKEQKIADKITEFINKPKAGMSIYEQPNALQEAIRQTEKNIENLKAKGVKETAPQFKAILKKLDELRNK